MDFANIQICFCWNRVELAMNFHSPHRKYCCLVRRGILFLLLCTKVIPLIWKEWMFYYVSYQCRLHFFPRSFLFFKATEHNVRLFIHSTIVCCVVLFMLHNIYILSRFDSNRIELNNSPFLYIGNGSLYGSLHSTMHADTDTHLCSYESVTYYFLSFSHSNICVCLCVCVNTPDGKNTAFNFFWREFLSHLTITNMKYIIWIWRFVFSASIDILA